MSKDAIKKFLDSTKEHADTVEVKIGDTVVTLGDLRALSADERGQIANKMKELEATEKDLKERQGKIVDLATKAQAAYDAAEKARAAAGSGDRGGAPPNDPFSDPWLAPVKEALTTRDKTIEELKGLLKQVATSVSNAASVWAEDRWDGQYNSINFGTREKKPTRDELIKYATDNNLLDRHKMPSITAAWQKMSEGERLEELKKSEYERGVEAGRQQRIAASVPPPGVPGAGHMPPVKVKPGEGDLGDLYAEANKDPELRQLLEAAGAAGIM